MRVATLPCQSGNIVLTTQLVLNDRVLQLYHAKAETIDPVAVTPHRPRCNFTMPKRKPWIKSSMVLLPPPLQLYHAKAETIPALIISAALLLLQLYHAKAETSSLMSVSERAFSCNFTMPKRKLEQQEAAELEAEQLQLYHAKAETGFTAKVGRPRRRVATLPCQSGNVPDAAQHAPLAKVATLPCQSGNL